MACHALAAHNSRPAKSQLWAFTCQNIYSSLFLEALDSSRTFAYSIAAAAKAAGPVRSLLKSGSSQSKCSGQHMETIGGKPKKSSSSNSCSSSSSSSCIGGSPTSSSSSRQYERALPLLVAELRPWGGISKFRNPAYSDVSGCFTYLPAWFYMFRLNRDAKKNLLTFDRPPQTC